MAPVALKVVRNWEHETSLLSCIHNSWKKSHLARFSAQTAILISHLEGNTHHMVQKYAVAQTSIMTQFWGVWCLHICEWLCVYVCACMPAWLSQTPENALKVVQLHIWICSLCKSLLNVWIILTWWQILPQRVLHSLTASQLHYWSRWTFEGKQGFPKSKFSPIKKCLEQNTLFSFHLVSLSRV